MRKVRILLVLGIWVTILPFLGFPSSWKDILFTLSGLFLVYLSYLLYKDFKEDAQAKTFDNFQENSSFSEIVIEAKEEEPVKLDQE